MLRELAEAAIYWRTTKNFYLTASKKQPANPAEVAKLRKTHLQAVSRLDKAVAEFEKLPEAVRKLKKRKKPLDWKKIVDGVAAATSALSKATDKSDFLDLAKGSRPPPVDMANVIDVQAED
jgi:hypothetical protein